MGDVATGQIGPETTWDIDFVDGMVKMKIDYAGKGAQAGAYASVPLEYYFTKLKEKIPGKVDDAVIDMLIAAAKGLS